MSELKPCPFCGSSNVATVKSLDLAYCDNYLEEYTAGIYNGTYLDSETSTGVKDPPAGHWKSQACIATKRMLELTAFLRKIILLGLLRGSPRLRDEALRILDGLEPSPPDVSTTQDVTTPEPPEGA